MNNHERRLERLEQTTADNAPLLIDWGDGAPLLDDEAAAARVMRVRWLRPDEEAAR